MRTYLRNLLPPVAVVALLSLVLQGSVAQRILVLTLIWAVGGLAWNLLAKAGQISLGHGAFTGIGAYTYVFLLEGYGLNPWLGMLAAMVLAAVAAVVIGIPTFRLQGFYFTLATMAYPLILSLLVINVGYPEVTVPFHPDEPGTYMQWPDPEPFVWLLAAVLVATLALTVAVDRGHAGRALRAIRDNEVLARSIGIRSDVWKLLAFTLSAAITAGLGVIWVNAVLLVVDAHEVFGIGVVILMLSVTFVGGIGRTWGPVLGAVVLVPLSELLTIGIGDTIPGAETLVYGIALVAAAVLAPGGLITVVDRVRARLAVRIPALRHPDPAPTADEAARAQATGRREPPTAGDVLLVVTGIGRSFGGLRVLEEVTFTLRAGERVGLIGPNGAGKTTLFNIVSGHLPPDTGSVELAGTEITRLKAPARFKAGLARTFQHPQGFSRLTVHENVAVAAIGCGLGADPDAAAAEALARVGLDGRAGAALSELTAYELKLLELARSLVAEPHVLLVDEPLAGLTEDERGRYFTVLEGSVAAETAVLVIEHSVPSLVRHVDRMIALDGGRLVADGDPADVVRDPHIIEAYLGSKWRAPVATAPVPGEQER